MGRKSTICQKTDHNLLCAQYLKDTAGDGYLKGPVGDGSTADEFAVVL